MTTTTDAGLIRMPVYGGGYGFLNDYPGYRSTLQYFGAKPGSSDSSEALRTALMELGQRNGVLILTPDEFTFESKVTVSTETPVGIVGFFGGSALCFVTPDDCGIDISMPYANSERSGVYTLGAPIFEGFSVLKKHTENVFSGTALKIMQVGVPPESEPVGRPGIHLLIDKLNIMTHPSISSSTSRQAAWENGLHVGRPNGGEADSSGGVTTHISNVILCGPLPSQQTSQPYGGAGITLDTATGSKLSQCHVFRFGTGFEVTGLTEGPSIIQSSAVATDIGVKIGPSQEPHFDATACHFNTFTCGVWAENRNSGFVTNCLFYQRQLSNSEEYNDIRLDGGAGWVVTNNQLRSSSIGTTPTNTVRFLKIVDTSNIIVSNNSGQYRSHFMDVAGTTTNIQEYANPVLGIPAANWVVDTSTGASNGSNLYQHRRALVSANITARLSADQSIADDTATEIAFDVGETFQAGGIAVPGRLAIPSGARRCEIEATVIFAANATGVRQVELYKNGALLTNYAPSVRVNASADGSTSLTISSAPIDMVPSDRITIAVYQNSGGALDVLSAGTWASLKILA